MRPLRALACGLLLLAASSLQPALSMSHSKDAIMDVANAYGYVVGQDEALAAVHRKFPDLGGDADLAKLIFAKAYGDARTRLHDELLAATNASIVAQAEAAVLAKVRQQLAGGQLTRADALAFIAKVKDRAKGGVEDPAVLAYLLAARFPDDPSGEFSAGFRQKFQTDGSGKALGLEVALELPASWKQSPGVRPHIVSKWVAEYGHAPGMMLLDIRDAGGANPTKAEIEQSLKPGGELAEVAAGMGRVNKSRAFMHEGVAGYVVDISSTLERAGGSVTARMEMYQIFYRGKAIDLQCWASAAEGEAAKADKLYESIRPACAQVMNSLVLLQKYR